MARATEFKFYNNGFVKGLITEASPLTYPQNATSDEDNCVLFTKGNRRRRLGIDYENNFALSTYTFTDTAIGDTVAITSHIWENAGDAGINFLTVQVGEMLYFFDLSEEPLSDGYKSFSVDMTSRAVSGASEIGSRPIYGVSGKGAFFVTGEKYNSFFITYDSTGDSITVADVDWRIRDFEGVEDNLDVDENPSTLSDEHKYNLFNQGWIATEGLEDGYVSQYNTTNGSYPSNAEIWHAAADATDNSFGSDEAQNLKRLNFGTTPAPRGHYILDPFLKDRATVSGILSLDSDGTQTRTPAAAFFSGRYWNAGDKGNIYFSQIIDNRFSNVGKAYQAADPTSYEDSSLVANDGGVVNIPEAGQFRAMRVVGSNLIVFAQNGIWAVSGADGFSATDYYVYKVSNEGISSFQSVVDVEGTPLWWSATGIYTLKVDSVSENAGAVSLTDETIRQYYVDIPATAKSSVQGAYDSANKTVIWMYSEDEDNPYKFTKVLNYNITLQAFYPWTIGELASNSPYVCGLFETPSLNSLTTTLDVVSGPNNDDVVSNTDDVQSDVRSVIDRDTSVKYLAVVPNGASTKTVFALFNNSTFYDWELADGTGVSYDSYLLTGHEVNNDVARFIQAPYIYTHFNKTEEGFQDLGGGNYQFIRPSSCYLTGRWEWTDNVISGRWTDEQQVYRFRKAWEANPSDLTETNGFAVTSSRTKLRGKGKALQLRFRSEEGKDFDILGWEIKYMGNADV